MLETYCVLIGEAKAIELFASKLTMGQVCEYSPGFKLIPYTSAVHLELCEKYSENPPGGDIEGTVSLNGATEQLAREASQGGKIAYLFEEHFGGWRDCDSVIWYNGNIIFGPTSEYEHQRTTFEKLGIDPQYFSHFKKYDCR
ncbi:MAG: hypothetical protein AAGF95_09310 [Chloroflexota bacterium]